MTEPEGPAVQCVVRGGDRLPVETGGAPAVCAAMTKAVRGSGASVIVTVINPHAATAIATVEGRAFPEQRIDVSDRKLNAQSIEMLAQAVARQLK